MVILDSYVNVYQRVNDGKCLNHFIPFRVGELWSSLMMEQHQSVKQQATILWCTLYMVNICKYMIIYGIIVDGKISVSFSRFSFMNEIPYRQIHHMKQA